MSNHYHVCLFVIVCLCLFVCVGDPASDPNVDGDPFKTLFVSRIVSLSLFGFSHFCIFVLTLGVCF